MRAPAMKLRPRRSSTKPVAVDFRRLRQESWHEYAVRFLFGGTITALAGWIGHRYGASLAGLWLAFPAILPASLTLVAQHERVRLRQSGPEAAGAAARRASAHEAWGAAVGGVGLVAFALVAWRGLAGNAPWFTLLWATLVWSGVNAALWRLRG